MIIPKLLIVDDCEDNQFILTHYLNDEGYDAIASTGANALSFVKSDSPDVILLRDFAQGGIALLDELGKQKILTRIIVLSRSGFSLETAIRYMKLGVCDYWVEPFTDEMFNSIRQIVATDCTLNLHILNTPPIVDRLLTDARRLQEKLKQSG